MKSYKIRSPRKGEGTHRINFQVISSTVNERLSEPVYYVDSPFALMDRLIRCRSKERIISIGVILDDYIEGSLVSRNDYLIRKLGARPIEVNRLNDLEYIEELAVYCWEKAVCMIEERDREEA